MPGFYSPSSQHMIQLRGGKKSKNPNVCIYKLVNVFEGCMGEGLNPITNNNKSLTVSFLWKIIGKEAYLLRMFYRRC